MTAVFRKIKADLTHRPAVALLILLTITASATLLTLAVATLMHMSAPYDQSFRELNAAHVWLFFDREVTSRRDIDRIEALPSITGSTGVRPYVLTRLNLGENHPWVSLRALPEEPPTVNRLLITEGAGLESDTQSGRYPCVLSKDLNDLYAVTVGDSVGVTRADGKEVELPVLGLAYNAMWDTYRSSQPPYVYVSEDTLRWLFPDEDTWGWSLGLRLADPEAVDATVAQIEALLRADAITEITDWHDVKRAAAFGGQINFIFLGSFSIFAILATVLVIASSIGSIVLSQFRQVGILKTIGFTRSQVLWLYLGQYLLLTVIGVALGLLAGAALAPLPLKSVAASLSTPYRPPLTPTLAALVLCATALVVALATLGAARRAANIPIVRALTLGAEPVRRRRGGGQLLQRLGLPIPLVLGAQDIGAKPLRSLLTGLNLTLGVIGIAFGLTLADTLDTYRANPALLGIVYDAAVTRSRIDDAQTQRLLKRAPGVEAIYSEFLVEAETPQGQTFSVRAVEGQLDAFPFPITEGRRFNPNAYEAIAGRGLLDWLGLHVGDTITLTFKNGSDYPVAWTIVGQYAEPVNAGQMMMLSTPLVSRWARGYDATTYFLKLSPDHDPVKLRAYLARRTHNDLNVVFVKQALPDAVIYLQYAIYALSAILIGIALINVFNTSLLSTREKVRTIGILKTVGMTPAQVIVMVNTTAACLGLIAAAIGAPLGYAFTSAVLAWLAASYGFGSVSVRFNGPVALMLLPATLIVSLIGSLLPSYQAARTSIVEVLTYE